MTHRLSVLSLSLTLLGVAIGAVILAPAVSGAAELRQQVRVERADIVLGDLFDGLDEEKAEQRVGAAPAPGRRAIFDWRYLGRIARAYRVEWQPTTTLDRIVVERAANYIRSGQIGEAVYAALSDGDKRLDISLDNKATTITLPTDVQPTMAVTDIDHDKLSGRFSALIVAPATGQPVYEGTVTGRVTEMIAIPVLDAPMRNGEIIRDADIVTLEVPMDQVNSDIITNPADLMGQTPRRSVSANQPVRARDIVEPTVVERGDRVTITLVSGGMNLTAIGRAMEDAAMDDLVRVRNITSDRVIDAVVTGPNNVRVEIR